MKPCDICGTAHESYQAHVFKADLATNKVANKVVVNAPVVVNVVVNAINKGRGKDRHKASPERLEYIRKKMREYRARKRTQAA